MLTAFIKPFQSDSARLSSNHRSSSTRRTHSQVHQIVRHLQGAWGSRNVYGKYSSQLQTAPAWHQGSFKSRNMSPWPCFQPVRPPEVAPKRCSRPGPHMLRLRWLRGLRLVGFDWLVSEMSGSLGSPSKIFQLSSCSCPVTWTRTLTYASETKPVPDRPRGQACCIPLKRGACTYPLSRVVARLKERLRILMILEGFLRQARPCYIPIVTGHVTSVVLLQSLGQLWGWPWLPACRYALL